MQPQHLLCNILTIFFTASAIIAAPTSSPTTISVLSNDDIAAVGADAGYDAGKYFGAGSGNNDGDNSDNGDGANDGNKDNINGNDLSSPSSPSGGGGVGGGLHI